MVGSQNSNDIGSGLTKHISGDFGNTFWTLQEGNAAGESGRLSLSTNTEARWSVTNHASSNSGIGLGKGGVAGDSNGAKADVQNEGSGIRYVVLWQGVPFHDASC